MNRVSDDVVSTLLGLIELAQESANATPEQFDGAERILRAWLATADPSSGLADDVRRCVKELDQWWM